MSIYTNTGFAVLLLTKIIKQNLNENKKSTKITKTK